MYRNEKLVGEAIRESGIDRGHIFVSECRIDRTGGSSRFELYPQIASKVASSYAGYDKAAEIINESLKLTGFGM